MTLAELTQDSGRCVTIVSSSHTTLEHRQGETLWLNFRQCMWIIQEQTSDWLTFQCALANGHQVIFTVKRAA